MYSYETILNHLYSNHYSDKTKHFSQVTSSHWKTRSNSSQVQKVKHDYILRGIGFGNLIPMHSIKAVKYFLPNMLAKKYLKLDIDKKIREVGFKAAKMSRRVLDFDCIKHILAVDMLVKKGIFNSVKTVMIIGDGYGYMTALIKMLLPRANVICINLGRVLFFDVYYLKKMIPEQKLALNCFDQGMGG